MMARALICVRCGRRTRDDAAIGDWWCADCCGRPDRAGWTTQRRSAELRVTVRELSTLAAELRDALAAERIANFSARMDAAVAETALVPCRRSFRDLSPDARGRLLAELLEIHRRAAPGSMVRE